MAGVGRHADSATTDRGAAAADYHYVSNAGSQGDDALYAIPLDGLKGREAGTGELALSRGSVRHTSGIAKPQYDSGSSEANEGAGRLCRNVVYATNDGVYTIPLAPETGAGATATLRRTHEPAATLRRGEGLGTSAQGYDMGTLPAPADVNEYSMYGASEQTGARVRAAVSYF